MADEDRAYLQWIREQPCAACLGPPPCEPHHHTHGPTQSEWVLGSRPKAERGARGMSQKAHDHYTIALHGRCHRQFHDGKGRFKDWTREQKRAWQDSAVAIHRACYLAKDEPPAPRAAAPRRSAKGSLFPTEALSLRQPWAHFMLELPEPWRKRIENRTWGPTKFRGPFWFHASVGMTKVEYFDAIAFATGIVGVPREVLPEFDAVKRGGIVGRGSIVGHIRPGGGPVHIDPLERSLDIFEGIDPSIQRVERGLNRKWHMDGQFGYVVADAATVQFVPCAGMLGFWRVPDDVLEQLRRQAA